MEPALIILAGAILIAVFSMMLQIQSQSDMFRRKLRDVMREDRMQPLRGGLSDAGRNRIHAVPLSHRISDAERKRIYADALSQRLSDAEREHYMREGAERMLGMTGKMSHTRKSD